MFRTMMLSLAAACAAVASAHAQVPATPPPTPAAAVPVWTVTEGMDSPESAYFDPVSGFIFVSQIGGQAAARDGNGRISKLTADGQVVDANWVKAGLNAPKGLRAFRGTLWTADLDEVVGIEISSGRITSRVKVDIGGEGKFFNDLDVGPDGTIYTSDSFGNRIYAIKDGQATVFFEGDAILLPNGVLVDGSRLIVASDGRPGRGGGGTPARLVAIDMKTKQLTQINTAPIGTPDGVEKDGHGGFILSDVAGGRLLQITPTGDVKVLRQVAASSADISLIADKGLVIVPHLNLNRVSAYKVDEIGK
jgi:sugar lactone lactonase YvrE